jgi:hypothetical protein
MTIQVLPVGTRKFPETMAASRSLSLELVLAVEYRILPQTCPAFECTRDLTLLSVSMNAYEDLAVLWI